MRFPSMNRWSSRLSVGAMILTLASGCSSRGGIGELDQREPSVERAFSVESLERHLYTIADDSMMGRFPGTEGDRKATEYIAAEIEGYGLEPAGEDGTYFQRVPLRRRVLVEEDTRVATSDEEFTFGVDYVPALAFGPVRPFDGREIVFGGTTIEGRQQLEPGDVAGKVVVMLSARGGEGIGARGIRMAASGPFTDVAAFVIVGGDELPAVNVEAQRRGSGPTLPRPESEPEPLTILITRGMAARLFDEPLEELEIGSAGKNLEGQVVFADHPVMARNVVAVLPGSDPELRDEYIAIGSHSDHIGVRRPADQDSLRAYNGALWDLQNELGRRPTAEERASIEVDMEALRQEFGPARIDSIANGADDNGSGTVAMLAIAEALANSEVKPRRSILFVWHTAEELGLLGSRWFTDHPTVPREQIVAHLNMDMVGRGAAQDIPGGGPAYLQLVGSRRLSTELGDLVEEVNAEWEEPFEFDYTFDADGHPERIYCRSDHWSYARYGIPIVFFTTGLHKDYHQVTDEPQYIDYPHMGRVARLVHDVARRVADLDHRVEIDGPVLGPDARCVQ